MKEIKSREIKGKQGRKKLTALLLCLLMLLTLVENVAYYPYAEKGDEQSGVATEMDASFAYAEELPVVADGADTSDVRELPNSSVQVVTYVNGVETSITDAGVLKNGDRIEVQLSWRIDNTGNAITDKTDLTYDLMATGVTISNTSGDVMQAGAAVGTYYVDNDGILHITITNSNLLSQSDITGNVNIQGVIDVSGLPEDEKGQSKAEIAGTTITVQKSDPTGVPSVNKQKSGSVYTDADGRIYQDFVATVTVNGSSNELTFTDTMGDYLSLVDGSFKVDGNAVTPTVNGNSISHIFSPVSKNSVYKITYTAEIDKAAYAKDFNSWDSGNEEYYNTVYVQDQYGSDSSRVFALDRKQWISKNNWVDNNAKTITWQIVVNSGDAIDISGAVVKDTLPDGLALVGNVTVKNSNWQEISSINGTAIDGNAILDGGFTFPDGAAGMYIFEYTTSLEEGAEGFSDMSFTNKAEITTDYFTDPKTDESTATISSNWVKKNYTNVNKTDKEITWETVITVPEGQSVTGLSYVDLLGTGLEAKLDSGAFDVSVAYSGAGTHTEASGTVNPSVTGNQFTVPLGDVTGPLTITVTYTTSFDPGTSQYFSFVNKGWLADDTEESKPVESTYQYEDDSVDILNYKWRVDSNGTKATWGIAVKDVQKLKDKLEADPTKRVYIYDTITLLKDDWTTNIDENNVKITLVDDSVKVTSWPNVNYGITGQVVDGRTIVFDITDQIIQGSYSNFDFQYTLDIDAEGIKYMMNDANQASTILERNEADAYIIADGDESTKEDAGSYESNDTAYLNVGDILTKNYSYTTATAPNAIYTIEINPEGYTLTTGGNGTLELEDVLGEKLQMKLSTLKMVDEQGTDVTSRLTVTYNSSTRTLNISGIPDATHYTLSYSVYVNVEYVAGSTFESLGVSDGVSNACRLFTADNWETSVEKTITGNVIKSSATADSNYGSITISKYCASVVLGGAKFELTPYKYENGKFVPYGNEQYNKDFPDATPAGKEIVTDTAKGEASVFLRFDTLYVLTETEAPAGYQKLNEPMYIIIRGMDYNQIEDAVADWENQYGTIDIKDSGEYHYVENKESSGYTLTINKNDSENLPVEGAGFTLYKYTGGVPDYDSEVNSGYTDVNGRLIFDVAEEGVYWLEETYTPSGYVSSFNGKAVTISEAAGTVNVTENITNEKLYGKYTIKKYISGTTEPLQGVEFGLYVENADGNKALQKTGTTDENGVLIFDKLELGTTYYIKEEKTLDGYIKLDDEWSFKPEGDTMNAPGLNAEETIYNEAEDGSIRITKVDADNTGKKLEGAVFILYDSNKAAIMKDGQPVTATTDINGIAEFTGLRFGTYYIREVEAPGIFEDNGIYYQYQIDDTYYELTVSDNIAVTKTITNKALRLNAPYISFKLHKNGVMPDGSTVAAANLAGATFKLYRGNGEGKTLAEIQQMELLGTAVSDGNGMVYFLNIQNLGKDANATLTLVETSAPTGYYLTDRVEDRIIVLDPTELDTNYAHADKYDSANAEDLAKVNSLVINGGDTVSNYRITGEVSLTKTNETGVKLPGAKYGLYKANQKLGEAVTDANGVVKFEDLDYGETYVIREIAAPDGYAVSDESFSITVGDAAPAGGTLTVDDKGVYAYAITAKDKELSVSISKKALSATAELPGATLKLYDSKNFEIDSWISGSTPHIVDSTKLQAGGIYTLKEINAPGGYAYSEDVTFQIGSDGTVTILSGDSNASANGSVVTMMDRRINFSLVKVDEGGNRVGGAKVQILTGDGNTVLYETTTLSSRDVVINPVIAGNTGITVPSEADGYSHYIYRESQVPSGYMQADDIHFCIDHYGKVYLCDENGNNRTLVADNKLQMVDAVDTSYVFISKGYSLNNNFVHIKGAVLKIQSYDDTLAAWTDVQDADGHVYSWSSTNDVKVFEPGAFTVGVRYRLVEEGAPFGYMPANPIEFTIETDGTENRVMVNNAAVAGNRIYMEDAPVYLEIDKRRQESGNYLSGATLEILNSQGQRIHYWNTAASAEKINLGLLNEDEEYILRESKAPYGYTKADDIVFKVHYNEADTKYEVLVKNAQNQFVAESDFKLTMYDKLSEISVSKYDLTGKKELDGARLVITEEGSARVVRSWTSSAASGPEEFTVLGTFDRNRVYKLTEESAPYGFAIADAIYFKLDESCQIWVSDKANGTFVKQNGSELVMIDVHKKLSISKTDITSGDEISGAKLVITDKTGTVVVPEWSSSASGAKVFDVLQYFKQDEVYTLTEITAPFGYELAESIDFKIDENGDIYWKQYGDDESAFTKVSGDTVVMEDAPKLLYISKIDLSNSEELAGARLTITDSSQQLIDSWTSSDSGKHEIKISKFAPNTEYTLREITAPNGYEIAENIIFRFDEAGSIYIKDAEGSFVKLTGDTIVMEDAPAEETICISKVDMSNSEEIDGAELIVTDENGNMLTTWVSSKEDGPKLIAVNDFNAGVVYTLTEITAPYGYEIAESILFRLDAEGRLWVKKTEDKDFVLASDAVIVMEDAPKYVRISKVDLTNDKELVGAKLIITDAEGNQLDEWISSGQVHEIPVYAFEYGKEYTLTEITAPDGYEVAESIIFMLDGQGNVYVKRADGTFDKLENGMIVMKDARKNTSVNTGDAMPLRILLAFMLISALGLILLVLRRRKI